MKTRKKIIIGVLVILSLYAGIVELDNYTNGGLYQISIHESTGNPNECWNKIDDGNMEPCKMGSGPSIFDVLFVVFGPQIILAIILIIFVVLILWRKRNSGMKDMRK